MGLVAASITPIWKKRGLFLNSLARGPVGGWWDSLRYTWSRWGRVLPEPHLLLQKWTSLKFPLSPTHLFSRHLSLHPQALPSPQPSVTFHHLKWPTLSLPIKPRMIENKERVNHCPEEPGVTFLNKNMHNSVAEELFLEVMNNTVFSKGAPVKPPSVKEASRSVGRQVAEQRESCTYYWLLVPLPAWEGQSLSTESS